jgi:uncharacterized tellurite resistance protein B-like protein
MLNQIRTFFDQYLNPTESPEQIESGLKLAAAALFLEMMTMDDTIANAEESAIDRLLKEKFNLDEQQAQDLIALANAQRTQATDYFQFTSMINKHYSQPQKFQLIKMLWQIAFADGVLDSHEEYFVRKIADLLYVPHSEFIQAKNQTIEENAR